jgi:curved DNA-binding protein
MDFSDLFSQAFGMGGGIHGGRQGGRSGIRGRDVEATLRLTLEEAFQGVEKSLQLASPGHAAKSVKVRVPPGMLPGRRLRVRGKGETSMHGQAGDLLLTIEVAPHPLFRLDGKDLYLDIPVTPWESVLGTTVTVPALSGNVRLRIPAGAKAGQKMRLTSKGMPDSDSDGDLYAIVRIVLPPEVSDEERALYEQLAGLSRFDPRPGFPKE